MRRREFVLSSAGALAASALSAQSQPGQGIADRTLPNLDPLDQSRAVFPPPAKMSFREGSFPVSEEVAIVIPRASSAQDLFVARAVQNEIADWYGIVLRIVHADEPPGNQRCIVVGFGKGENLPPESYRIHVRPERVVVAGADFRGALYGCRSLCQMLGVADGKLTLPAVDIWDSPSKPFRGLKLYLPGRANIPFFKRFVRDLMVPQKYNTLIMEMNAGMRLESHPELNAGWREMVEDTNYNRLNYPPGAFHGREQNSCHQDTADGSFIEKEEVLELAAWVRSHGIELVLELPSYTHSYYLLTRHKDLSEVPGDKWPDTYCPSNPATYKLLFEVYDEYLDLLKPKLLHVGHDELFAPAGVCPRCKDKDAGERYGEDVARIHSYLQGKGVRTAMWGDMLMESVRGKGLQNKRAPDGWTYRVAGGLRPEQVNRFVPKDTLIFNWFWHKEEGLWPEEQGEQNEAILDGMGYEQIFGNFAPSIENYDARKGRRTLLGGAPSAWFATNEWNFGKNLMADFLGCSQILWSGAVLKPERLAALTQARLPDLRARLRGSLPPSSTEAAMTCLSLAPAFNAKSGPDLDMSRMRAGRIFLRHIPFELAASERGRAVIAATQAGESSTPAASTVPIRVGKDVSSVIFLHASARAASNQEPDRLLWDVIDSADLLGWYEVVYEDEFLDTIPIRYGVNIAEWNWARRVSERDYCYGADALTVGGAGADPITMFAFEWPNPRLGKAIREIRLRATNNFRSADPDYSNHYGPAMEKNAVILAAITVVERRDAKPV